MKVKLILNHISLYPSGGGDALSSISPRHDHCDEALPQSPKHNSSSGDSNSEDSNIDDDGTNGGGVGSSSPTSESDSTCSAPKPSKC